MKDVSGERSPLVLTIPVSLADSCTVDEKQRANKEEDRKKQCGF